MPSTLRATLVRASVTQSCLLTETELILNLQTAGDEAVTNIDRPSLQTCYRSHSIAVRRVPVRDFDPADFLEKPPQCVRTLRELHRCEHRERELGGLSF